jgi:hypothetical protein
VSDVGKFARREGFGETDQFPVLKSHNTLYNYALHRTVFYFFDSSAHLYVYGGTRKIKFGRWRFLLRSDGDIFDFKNAYFPGGSHTTATDDDMQSSIRLPQQHRIGCHRHPHIGHDVHYNDDVVHLNTAIRLREPAMTIVRRPTAASGRRVVRRLPSPTGMARRRRLLCHLHCHIIHAAQHTNTVVPPNPDLQQEQREVSTPVPATATAAAVGCSPSNSNTTTILRTWWMTSMLTRQTNVFGVA